MTTNRDDILPSAILNLVARDVKNNEQCLDGAGAYVTTFPADGCCGVDVNMTTDTAFLLAIPEASDLTDTDPDDVHAMMPRYELLPAELTPPLACVWASLVITPLSGRGDDLDFIVEMRIAPWLDEEYRRGARRILKALLQAARDLDGNGEAA